MIRFLSQLLGLVLTTTFAIASIAGAETPQSLTVPKTKRVSIGLISGLTGAAAKWGRYQNMGITLAKEEYQDAGWDVSLVIEDSATEAPKVISAFNKLVTFDHVQAILGNDFGFVFAPLLPIAEKRKVLTVAISLPHPHYCAQAPNYFFSMTSQFSRSREAFNQFFVLHPEVKRAAFYVFDDPEWGQAYARIWADLAKAHGVEVVDTFANNEWRPDFKSALAKTLNKNPDVIFLAHEPETFTKALQASGYKGSLVVANHVYEMLADSPRGRKDLAGVYVVDPLISEDFRQRFEKRFNLPPILEAYAGYEAMRSILKAFELNPVQPERGMRGVKYEGVAGPVDLTGSSCAGNLAVWGLFQFSDDGKPELVWKP